ncbi:MAG: serine/threonine protein kinase [Lachnospiraceae bacterium]|nr:serine/threonine protein kinase [Lachnospiraceae bacterium]
MKLCMGCMQEIEDHAAACPYCGYNEMAMQQEEYYLRPGTVIGGKYIAGRVLRYGGDVIKYIGMDAERNHKVTISEYLPSDFSTRSEGETEVTIYSGDALEQFNQGLITFLNEGNLIQQLGDIEGIARIYDCVAENETGYYISEYLEGENLQQILDKGRQFSPEEARVFINEILRGLQKVHSLGVFHCDIAPENIFVSCSGAVKLLDFGSAKYATTVNSQSLAIILKQGYAPEEQYRSRGERGAWTDVYALAAVMYRMITGKVPIESADRTLEDTLEDVSDLVPDMPRAMGNALMNALNVYQDERTSSAAEFFDELNSQDTKRRKVKHKKYETEKMPIWVKGLVAVVACTVIAGGAVLYRAHLQEKQLQVAGKVDEKFDTGINKPYESFQKNWKKYGFEDSDVEVEFRYDNSVSIETVMEFEDYTDTGCLVDGAAVKSIKKDKAIREKEVFAKIVVASADRYTFLPGWKSNAPMAVGENKTVTYHQKRFYGTVKVSGDVSKPYGVVKGITVDGKAAAPSDLAEPFYVRDRDGHKKNEVVISIYAGSYYLMEADGKKNSEYYKGRNVSDIQFKYGTGKGGKWDSRSLEPSKYEQNYVSFNQNIGTIVEVESESLARGRKYDGSREIGGMLFDTVGVRLTYGVTTVGELKRQHCRIKNSSQYKNSDLVTWTEKATFKKNEEVAIKAMPKPTPTPKPEPTATPKPAPVQQKPTVTKKPAKKQESYRDYRKVD